MECVYNTIMWWQIITDVDNAMSVMCCVFVCVGWAWAWSSSTWPSRWAPSAWGSQGGPGGRTLRGPWGGSSSRPWGSARQAKFTRWGWSVSTSLKFQYQSSIILIIIIILLIVEMLKPCILITLFPWCGLTLVMLHEVRSWGMFLLIVCGSVPMCLLLN